MLDQGLEPEMAEMTAYFPGVTHGISITSTQRNRCLSCDPLELATQKEYFKQHGRSNFELMQEGPTHK